MLAVFAIAVSGCGGDSSGSAAPVVDEAAIYGDLVVRLCDQARCGPSHPAFVLLATDTAEARTGVLDRIPDAVFIASTDGLVGPDDQVIEGGRILRLGALRLQPSKEIVVIDTFWESSPFEGKGETYVYQWDGDAWANIEPSTVGITVTTAVP
jgi:hypothetical protein